MPSTVEGVRLLSAATATPEVTDFFFFDGENGVRKISLQNLIILLQAAVDASGAAALLTTGGTMTGDIVLKGDPTENLHPVTLQYLQEALEGIGIGTTDADLIQWTASRAFQFLNITRDADRLITSATVLWPDGSAGVYTMLEKQDDPPACESYEVTHVDSGKTITQPAPLQRDEEEGDVLINQPLEVSATVS